MSGWSPLHASRRAVLATGAVTMASVAGCSAISSEPPKIDLTLFSDVDVPYTVYVHLYRVDDELSRSDARVYSESIDVEPEGEARRDGIAEIRQYVVRYEAYEDDSRQTDEGHVHYYPVEDGDDEDVTFDLRPPGEITRRHG